MLAVPLVVEHVVRMPPRLGRRGGGGGDGDVDLLDGDVVDDACAGEGAGADDLVVFLWGGGGGRGGSDERRGGGIGLLDAVRGGGGGGLVVHGDGAALVGGAGVRERGDGGGGLGGGDGRRGLGGRGLCLAGGEAGGVAGTVLDLDVTAETLGRAGALVVLELLGYLELALVGLCFGLELEDGAVGQAARGVGAGLDGLGEDVGRPAVDEVSVVAVAGGVTVGEDKGSVDALEGVGVPDGLVEEGGNALLETLGAFAAVDEVGVGDVRPVVGGVVVLAVPAGRENWSRSADGSFSRVLEGSPYRARHGCRLRSWRRGSSCRARSGGTWTARAS